MAEVHDILNENIGGRPGEDFGLNRNIVHAMRQPRHLLPAVLNQFTFEPGGHRSPYFRRGRHYVDNSQTRSASSGHTSCLIEHRLRRSSYIDIDQNACEGASNPGHTGTDACEYFPLNWRTHMF